MASDKDIERLVSGKENWNSWATNEITQAEAEKRKLVTVDFSGHSFPNKADFSGYIFPGGANFTSATFAGEADFTGATFSSSTYADRANFDDCIFIGIARFYEATFLGVATFARAKFSHEALFTRCSFADAANFFRSQFLGEVNFWEVTFSSNAKFENAEFVKRAEFTQATFNKLTLFTGAIFSSGSTFEGTRYSQPPNFLSTVFNVPPLMINAQVTPTEKTWWKMVFGKTNLNDDDAKLGKKRWQMFFGKANLNDDAAKYRRLKQLAQESRDHESTLRFLGQELKAKRFYETTGLSLIPNILYGILSNFGQSIARPLTWLFFFIAIPSIYYTTLAYPWTNGISPASALICGTYLSITASGYLIGWEKLVFHQKSLACLGLGSVPQTGQALATFPLEVLFMLQSAMSLLLFFLAGLALRNRFRLGGGDGN